MPPSVFKETFQKFYAGDHKSKTIFEQVSNFWLSQMPKYSGQKTKSLTGAVGNKDAPPTDQKKLAKAKSAGQREVNSTFKDTDRGKFYESFDKSKLSLTDVIQGGEKFFEGNKAKGRAKTTHGGDMKLSDLIFDYAIRRSCKFLLYDSISKGKNVAYLLDDLDLDKVAYLVVDNTIPDSARIVGGPSDGKVPICSTEIRELFRNWDSLCHYVKFFEKMYACKAPWERSEFFAKWAAYAKHRAEKLLEAKRHEMPSGDVASFIRCIELTGGGLHEKAIKTFHEAHPSMYGKRETVHSVSIAPETRTVNTI
jgi:hypothetical protein